MTTPQEEAERRYPQASPTKSGAAKAFVAARAFIAGAEWQSERLGPLVEAARAYRAEFMATGFATNAAVVAVLAAAAALDEEGGE